MKVLLTAFHGKLQSDVLDYPENTTDRIHLILDMDTATWGWESEVTPKNARMRKAEFAWDGKTTIIEHEPVRHYKLIDVR